jgi:Protein of unknown function (DUF3293)
MIVLYRAAEQGIDGSRYAVVCSKHGHMIGDSNAQRAKMSMRDPSQFCPDCSDAATKIAGQRVEDRLIAARVAHRWLVAFGVTDLDKLSRMGRSFGVISAYRSGLSKSENQVRHGDLMADLQKDGWRPQPLKAKWEDMVTGVSKKEKSLLVPNIDFRRLQELGEQYEQDAVLFKDPSGSIGIYKNNNVANMAYDSQGEMAITKSTDPFKEYSRGRGLSFGLDLVDRDFPYHGKPITRRDIQDAVRL